MRKQIRHTFTAPLQKVLTAREERNKRLAEKEGFNKVEFLEYKEEGDYIIEKRHLHIESEIPQAVRAFVPGGIPVIEEVSRFHVPSKSNVFEVYIPEHPKAFHMKGVSRYFEEDGHAVREYDIEITSKAPLVGGVIERAVWGFQEKNLNKDFNNIEAFIAETSD